MSNVYLEKVAGINTRPLRLLREGKPTIHLPEGKGVIPDKSTKRLLREGMPAIHMPASDGVVKSGKQVVTKPLNKKASMSNIYLEKLASMADALKKPILRTFSTASKQLPKAGFAAGEVGSKPLKIQLGNPKAKSLDFTKVDKKSLDFTKSASVYLEKIAGLLDTIYERAHHAVRSQDLKLGQTTSGQAYRAAHSKEIAKLLSPKAALAIAGVGAAGLGLGALAHKKLTEKK